MILFANGLKSHDFGITQIEKSESSSDKVFCNDSSDKAKPLATTATAIAECPWDRGNSRPSFMVSVKLSQLHSDPCICEGSLLLGNRLWIKTLSQSYHGVGGLIRLRSFMLPSNVYQDGLMEFGLY
jgi:hypothetical protein